MTMRVSRTPSATSSARASVVSMLSDVADAKNEQVLMMTASAS